MCVRDYHTHTQRHVVWIDVALTQELRQGYQMPNLPKHRPTGTRRNNCPVVGVQFDIQTSNQIAATGGGSSLIGLVYFVLSPSLCRHEFESDFGLTDLFVSPFTLAIAKHTPTKQCTEMVSLQIWLR